MRTRWRRFLSSVVVALCGLSVLLALVPLALVLFYVVSQGATSLNVATMRGADIDPDRMPGRND